MIIDIAYFTTKSIVSATYSLGNYLYHLTDKEQEEIKAYKEIQTQHPMDQWLVIQGNKLILETPNKADAIEYIAKQMKIPQDSPISTKYFLVQNGHLNDAQFL